MARRDAGFAGLRWERASRVIYRLAVRPNTGRGRHGLAVWPGPGADWGGASKVACECRAVWPSLGADWGGASKVAWRCRAVWPTLGADWGGASNVWAHCLASRATAGVGREGWAMRPATGRVGSSWTVGSATGCARGSRTGRRRTIRATLRAARGWAGGALMSDRAIGPALGAERPSTGAGVWAGLSCGCRTLGAGVRASVNNGAARRADYGLRRQWRGLVDLHNAAFEEARFGAVGDGRPVNHGCIALNPDVAPANRRFFLRDLL